MIYVRPRKRMSVERMRRQQTKHHPNLYRVWYIDANLPKDLDQDSWLWLMNEHKAIFRREVLKWNMWRKAPLSDVTAHLDLDFDFNRYRLLFEVRRLKALPIKEFW